MASLFLGPRVDSAISANRRTQERKWPTSQKPDVRGGSELAGCAMSGSWHRARYRTFTDGLVARMLWCFPEPLPGFTISRETSSDGLARSAVTRLSQLPMGIDGAGEPCPVVIELENDAVDLLEKFGQEIAEDVLETTGIYGGVLGKARGHALRLSCILEHLWWAAAGHASGEPRFISARAVGAACEMMEEYFLPMAKRVLGDASIPVAERNATALASHIRRLKCATFNARELRREIGGVLRESSSMEAACGVLEEAGIIRGCHARQGSTKGRAAKAYEVNPEIWSSL